MPPPNSPRRKRNRRSLVYFVETDSDFVVEPFDGDEKYMKKAATCPQHVHDIYDKTY